MKAFTLLSILSSLVLCACDDGLLKPTPTKQRDSTISSCAFDRTDDKGIVLASYRPTNQADADVIDEKNNAHPYDGGPVDKLSVECWNISKGGSIPVNLRIDISNFKGAGTYTNVNVVLEVESESKLQFRSADESACQVIVQPDGKSQFGCKKLFGQNGNTNVQSGVFVILY